MLTDGTKIDDETIIVQIDETNLKVGIANLLLGVYRWQEVTTPEGYQKDQDISF